MTSPRNHEEIYSQAMLYDIAFDYRNIQSEVDFLIQATYGSPNEISSILELAAGPARHALEFAQRGAQAAALDLSPQMVAYGQSLADQMNLTLDYMQSDMREFQLESPVDLAFTLIDSASYLFTSSDFLKHMNAVYDSLHPGGFYVLETAHPNHIFKTKDVVDTTWEMERDGVKVEMQWGSPDDTFDPVSQIAQVHVTLKAQTPDGPLEFKETAAQRLYTWPELQLLFERSPLQFRKVYGAFDLNCSLEGEKAWRILSVLQRPAPHTIR